MVKPQQRPINRLVGFGIFGVSDASVAGFRWGHVKSGKITRGRRGPRKVKDAPGCLLEMRTGLGMV